MSNRKASIVLLATITVLITLACGGRAVGRYYRDGNTTPGWPFVALVDGKTFESNHIKGTYKIEGTQITFEGPLGSLQRGVIENDTITLTDSAFISLGAYKKPITSLQTQGSNSGPIENIAPPIPVDNDLTVERLLSASMPASVPYDSTSLSQHLKIPIGLSFSGGREEVRGYRLPGRNAYRCIYYVRSGEKNQGAYELIDDFVSDWSYTDVGGTTLGCPNCSVTKDYVEYSFGDQTFFVKRRDRNNLARPWQWPPNPSLKRTR